MTDDEEGGVSQEVWAEIEAEVDAWAEAFEDNLVREMRRRHGGAEPYAYDPNQPRDEQGRWAEFAGEVHRVAKGIPDATAGHKNTPKLESWRGHQPLISDVFDRLDAPAKKAVFAHVGQIDLPSFKAALLEGHRRKVFSLHRTDMVNELKGKDPLERLRRSEIAVGGTPESPLATFHTLDTTHQAEGPGEKGQGAPRPAATPSDHGQQIMRAHAALDKEGKNFTSLVELRKALPELSREEFDQGIAYLRRWGKLRMSAAEGRHGISEEQRAAAIPEEGSLLLHASRLEKAGS